jgi:hypothetical protein
MKPLFDLIAPIAIYHAADLLYKDKARRAIRELSRRVAAYDPDLANRGFYTGQAKEGRLAGYLEFVEPHGLPNILDLYRDLFDELLPDDWTWEHDHWGARAIYDEQHQRVMAGDGPGEFPWYETVALLLERFSEHQMTQLQPA